MRLKFGWKELGPTPQSVCASRSNEPHTRSTRVCRDMMRLLPLNPCVEIRSCLCSAPGPSECSCFVPSCGTILWQTLLRRVAFLSLDRGIKLSPSLVAVHLTFIWHGERHTPHSTLALHVPLNNTPGPCSKLRRLGIPWAPFVVRHHYPRKWFGPWLVATFHLAVGFTPLSVKYGSKEGNTVHF